MGESRGGNMNEEVQKTDELKLVLALRQLGLEEVQHDTYEVEHGDMRQILGAYGILESFDAAAMKVLRCELFWRAREMEFEEAEVWALAAQERDVAPWWLPDRPAPSLGTLRLQHLAWVAARRAQGGDAQ